MSEKISNEELEKDVRYSFDNFNEFLNTLLIDYNNLKIENKRLNKENLELKEKLNKKEVI